MNQHSRHDFGSFTTNSGARRRRIRAARKRMAATRARMAALHASTMPAPDILRATDTAG
ncbi:hypothetical protein [Actinophytocola glycyrrhizae]|uniref:Uncharacterized protein n=1 Tax=Actinophytocola glycyrrhizae TaxID=2044873 RepID=A0ABV9RUR0_9PSEU